MRLTKLVHSCVRLEKDGGTLVIDPGMWSSAADALRGAHAVLVTHEHPDHLDAGALRAALGRDAGLELWSNESVTRQFAEFGARVHTVAHGDAVTAAGFDVHVYGRDHALIYRDIPVIPNTGFAVDGQVFHPGDAFTIPEEQVPTLLVPASAPFLTATDMIDFAREIAPQRAYAIHDGILNANGLGLVGRLLPLAHQTTRLEPGTAVDL
jgi:L-ascorbate metabolism protein UlaG (beta-lactamase superfamily)